MIDIRQSETYAQFLKKIGWQVEKVNSAYVFIKKFPPVGSFIKIQRINLPIPFLQIEKIAQKYRAFQIIIEPGGQLSNLVIKKLREFKYKASKSPFSPSKTIIVDLKKDEKEIYKNFSKGKRWDIKKAEKNKVKVRKSEEIDQFIKIKNEKMGAAKFLLGRSQEKQIKALWQTFSPKNAVLLLALCSNDLNHGNKPIAGILLLFHDRIAYYWLAGSTKKGNKLGAPSLLVWEGVKLAKKKGCEIFDFEGIEDPRYKSTSSWSGFTRFKKGFGGKEVEYPGVFGKYRLPL